MNSVKGLFVAVWFILASFSQAAPAIQFRSASTNIAGLWAHSVEVADLRGQGKLDIITANWGSDDVSVHLGHGNGSFAAATNFPANSYPASTAAGDFDADGTVDIVVANHQGGYFGYWTLLHGCGDGSFGSATNLIWAMSGDPKSVAVGDFNQDGKLDFVSVDLPGGWVEVMTNKGGGNFESQKTYSIGSPGLAMPYHVVVADLNHDGKLDVVTANSGLNSVGVLIGNGNGTFKTVTNFPAGSSPFGVAIGDFNADGKLDAATANRSGKNVSVLLGSGNGAFGSPVQYPVGSLPRSVATGDFNLDGQLDLVVANEGSNTVSILAGIGDGTFAAAVNYKVGRKPYSVAVGDFDQDGQLDIVTANYDDGTVSLLLNETFPVLKVNNLNDQIRLAWPVSATGFVLEVSCNLGETNNWEAVTNNCVIIGGQQVITNPIGSGNKFFRLRR